MTVTKEEISNWFNIGVELKATHMIVVCDTFDYEDYPVYVQEDQNVHKIEKESDHAEMQKVMEVYCLTMDKEAQLDQTRAFNY